MVTKENDTVRDYLHETQHIYSVYIRDGGGIT